MPVLSPFTQVIVRYFLFEAVGSAKGLYFLHLCMDLSEILRGSPQMNILFSYLIVVFQKWQIECSKLPGSRSHLQQSSVRPI